MKADLIWPLKWATVHDGVVTTHEKDPSVSSLWEEVMGPGYICADILSDPNAVHANMLRGTIAKPSLAQIIHLYGSQALLDEIHICHGPEFVKPRNVTAVPESHGVDDGGNQKWFARGVIVGAVAMAIGVLIGFMLP